MARGRKSVFEQVGWSEKKWKAMAAKEEKKFRAKVKKEWDKGDPTFATKERLDKYVKGVGEARVRAQAKAILIKRKGDKISTAQVKKVLKETGNYFPKGRGKSNVSGSGDRMTKAQTATLPWIQEAALGGDPWAKTAVLKLHKQFKKEQGGGGGSTKKGSGRSEAAKKAWATRKGGKGDTGWRTIKGRKVKVTGKKK